jgi:hypothetical protein
MEMNRTIRVFTLALMTAGLAMAVPCYSQEPAKEPNKKDKQKSDRARE